MRKSAEDENRARATQQGKIVAEPKLVGERKGGQEGVPDDALAGMLADGGGDVDRGIGVMHAMVAPERRHPVHGDMGHVEGQVERQDADDA